MDILALAALFLALIAVAAVVIFVVRARPAADGAQAEFARLAQQQGELIGQLRQLSQSGQQAQADLARHVNERLEAMTKRLGDGLVDSVEKTGAKLGELNERMVRIDEAQKRLVELSGQVTSLQQVLDNKQARGAFGEVQLGNLIRDALPPNAYEEQATLANGKRVDCLIKLPNPPGSIAIDAKFPLESFRALMAAVDEPARVVAARAFTVDVQKHVDDISDKYMVPGETADSALMFLPSEAVYAELHARFENVMEHARRRRVWIVSPTTLMAVLTTVRAVLKDARMREQAHVIQKHVELLAADVKRLDERTGNLRKHFDQAEKDIKEIETSSSRIARRSDQIGELDIEAPEVPAALPPQ